MSSDRYSLPSVIDLSDAETCARLEERARFDTWVALEEDYAALSSAIPDEVEQYAQTLADDFMGQQSVSIQRVLFRDLREAKRARSAIRDRYLRATLAYLPRALREFKRQLRACGLHI
jgi:hypothetical protein